MQEEISPQANFFPRRALSGNRRGRLGAPFRRSPRARESPMKWAQVAPQRHGRQRRQPVLYGGALSQVL